MLWARIFKAGGGWQYSWDNDYFFEENVGVSQLNTDLGHQLALWDMSWHLTACALQVVYFGDAFSAMAADWQGCACWVQDKGIMYGRRDLDSPMSYRTALMVTNYRKMGRPTHKYYRSAVSRHNVHIDENGRISWKGDAYLDFSRWDEMIIGCQRLIGKERIGIGEPVTGAAGTWEKPIKTIANHVSYLNANRRLFAMRISAVMQFQTEMNGIVIAAMWSWYAVAGMVHISYQGFWPKEMKERAMEAVGAVISLSKAFSAMIDTKLENGDTVENCYTPLSGPTVTMVKQKLNSLEQAADKALKGLGNIVPFAWSDGESYLTDKDASDIWTTVEDYHKRLAVAGWFDCTSPLCEGAGKHDRIGGYHPGFPDL